MATGVVVAVTWLAGCGSPGPGGDERRFTVLAAASLTEPFTVLAKRFEAQHPGVDVVTGFDSSATLAAQVAAGAPADVVATADPRTMRLMARSGALSGEPVVFARNRPALVVPPDNPAGITELADLDRADYVVCTPTAPCGALAARILADEGVTRRPRSLEVDVKAVLTKVLLDEVDAGLVYASDVVAAGNRVREIPLPRGAAVSTDYPAAVTADSSHPGLGAQWVALLRSETGIRVLTRAGFDTPPPTTGRGGPDPRRVP